MIRKYFVQTKINSVWRLHSLLQASQTWGVQNWENNLSDQHSAQWYEQAYGSLLVFHCLFWVTLTTGHFDQCSKWGTGFIININHCIHDTSDTRHTHAQVTKWMLAFFILLHTLSTTPGLHSSPALPAYDTMFDTMKQWWQPETHYYQRQVHLPSPRADNGQSLLLESWKVHTKTPLAELSGHLWSKHDESSKKVSSNIDKTALIQNIVVKVSNHQWGDTDVRCNNNSVEETSRFIKWSDQVIKHSWWTTDYQCENWVIQMSIDWMCYSSSRTWHIKFF